MRGQHSPVFLVWEISSAHPTSLSFEVPVKCRMVVTDVGKVCKRHLLWVRGWGRGLCLGHHSPVCGKQVWMTQGLGSVQQKAATCASSEPGSGKAIMKVWTETPPATQEALSHHPEWEIFLFLRVCANWLKANTRYFPLFFIFSRVSKKFQDSASVLGILFGVLRNQTGLTVGIRHCGRNSSHLNANVF